jgi:antibiotic biosynthesis monooxygenase (ABM) superfamily enzyme
MEPTKAEQDEYIAQLTPQEQIVLKIAQEHLESSFDMVRSIGFKAWFVKKQQQKQQPDK